MEETRGIEKPRYALFVASTGNYLGYLLPLLNSIEKQQLYRDCDLTVYLLLHEFDNPYSKAAEVAYSFRVLPVEVERQDLPHPEGTKRIEFIKRARYLHTLMHGREYDVTILMDADMFFVSPDFMKLADMVRGTRYLIGCNERFKWDVGEKYQYQGKPILEHPSRLHMFHCNVPAIFDMNAWHSVFRLYTEMCFEARQWKKEQWVGVGDIYNWNIAVYRMNRERDVILFPMSTMTQVHGTAHRPWTYLIVEDGREGRKHWRTFAGDPVYSIHGRVAQKNYVAGHMALFEAENPPHIRDGMSAAERTAAIGEHQKLASKVEAGLKWVQREWYDLAMNQTLKLSDFMDADPMWDAFEWKG